MNCVVFVGFKSDVVHRQSGLDAMFPEHRLVVGAMWMATTSLSLLYLLHAQLHRANNITEQAELSKDCKWDGLFLTYNVVNKGIVGPRGSHVSIWETLAVTTVMMSGICA